MVWPAMLYGYGSQYQFCFHLVQAKIRQSLDGRYASRKPQSFYPNTFYTDDFRQGQHGMAHRRVRGSNADRHSAVSHLFLEQAERACLASEARRA